jgi:hypothetical protein
MSRGTPAQANFNGGEISQRLRGRHDLAIYDIALEEMTGFVPLVEGGMEACPGFLHVETAAGPCRLLPFEPSATQSHVIEMSAGSARFFTNDARIESSPGVPIALAHPYNYAQVQALTWHGSYDALILYHPAVQTRQIVRTGANSFALETLQFENGPWEPRNKDQAITVSASAVSGAVTLSANSPIFEPGDVGGLFQIEADDFGDITAWEPGITVSPGQLLTWTERVYRVAGGAARTGTVPPVHSDGIEWDGIGSGSDVNNEAAGGVQLEYLCDRFGILRIDSFASATSVGAMVLRRLPFTSSASYEYTGGYYSGEWGEYIPPQSAVTYLTGTWRWRFGSFSDRRGWPSAGLIWNERHILAKENRLFGSVAGDLGNHATYNENGDISADMAFQVALADANPITALIGEDRLIALTSARMHVILPSNAANGLGPGNIKAVRQTNEGAAQAMPVSVDGRSIYIGRSGNRLIEADYDVQVDRQARTDLTRYARHIGAPGQRFVAMAVQKDPLNLIWALREDGSLCCAAYVPEEQVLGWAQRPLAAGLSAISLCEATDPYGRLGQIWIAATWRGATHILRLDAFREDASAAIPAMTDMAFVHDGAALTDFGPLPLLAATPVHVQADGRTYSSLSVDGGGMVKLAKAASRVKIGLPFPARATTLPISSNGDNGPARDKMKRISRVSLDLLASKGLRVRAVGGRWHDIEQQTGSTLADDPFPAETGIVLLEDVGDWSRDGCIQMERIAPAPVTIRALQCTVEVQQR